jgi:hypothetical protein
MKAAITTTATSPVPVLGAPGGGATNELRESVSKGRPLGHSRVELDRAVRRPRWLSVRTAKVRTVGGPRPAVLSNR